MTSKNVGYLLVDLDTFCFSFQRFICIIIMAAKNAVVSWGLNFRVHMLLKDTATELFCGQGLQNRY